MSTIKIFVDSTLYDDPKTFRLVDKIGDAGLSSVILLWLWVARNRSPGVLRDMTHRDIARAARWSGDADEFVGALSSPDVRFLEVGKDNLGNTEYTVHNWEFHNAYCQQAEERAEHARALARAKSLRRRKAREEKDNSDRSGPDQTATTQCVELEQAADVSSSDRSGPVHVNGVTGPVRNCASPILSDPIRSDLILPDPNRTEPTTDLGPENPEADNKESSDEIADQEVEPAGWVDEWTAEYRERATRSWQRHTWDELDDNLKKFARQHRIVFPGCPDYGDTSYTEPVEEKLPF